ncbi:hypothetical protein RB195_003765 [Necator americanus]|uniref:Uncharacterized protein n=1 Tax=Necator americanus TaxID=51031 RepID=A0ABR1DQ15_NECAM
MDLEKFYREDHILYKVIVGDCNARIGPEKLLRNFTSGLTARNGGRRGFPSLSWRLKPSMGTRNSRCPPIYAGRGIHLVEGTILKLTTSSSAEDSGWERTPFTRREQKAAKFRERSPRTTVDWDLFATLAGSWEDSMDRIDDECDQVVEHLRDCTRRAQSSKNFKRRLLLETLDLLQFYQSQDEDECFPEPEFNNHSIEMQKIIHDFYSDLFDSYAHLPPHNVREDGHAILLTLPSEVRHAIMSVRNRTASGPTA